MTTHVAPTHPLETLANAQPLRDSTARESSKPGRKSVVSDVLKSAARRRAGANELPTPHYLAEQQRRMQKAKRTHRALPGRAHMKPALPTFKALFCLPKPSEAAQPDVEMRDADADRPRVTITVPAKLSRPKYKQVSVEKVAALDKGFEGIPIEYVQDELARLGAKMLNVLESVEVPPPPPVELPKEITIHVHDLCSDLPTHMFAVYKKDLRPDERMVVKMFAGHRIIWDVNCAHLPSLPASHDLLPSDCVSPARITIPVVPLGVSDPENFRQVMCYLYTKRADLLAADLLPSPPPCASEGQDAMDRYARSLAREYGRGDLLRMMSRVQGVWRNVCALGVFDDGMWAMLDLVWDIYGKAISANIPGKALPSWDPSLTTLSFR